MEPIAKNIMVSNYHTIPSKATVAEAVRAFKEAGGPGDKRRVFGMMVVDEQGNLIGMLSMYDILILLRPKHIHIWADMDDIDISGIIDTVCERARNVKVEDIMTTEVITVTPETHLFTILDIMLRKHVRRIPVIDKGTIVGIVYISDLFYFLYDKLAATGPQQNGSSRKT